jgi:SnoaL-like domain
MNEDAGIPGSIEELVTKQALHELNMGYCRAVDRLDMSEFIDLFHADAVVDSGVLRGAPEEFARQFSSWVRLNARVTSHNIANEWFRVDGARALGESSVVAFSRLRAKRRERDMLTFGRYFDNFEQRDGRWKFLQRRFVLDHTLTLAAGLAPLLDRPPSDSRGAFAPDDPIYHFWKQT